MSRSVKVEQTRVEQTRSSMRVVVKEDMIAGNAMNVIKGVIKGLSLKTTGDIEQAHCLRIALALVLGASTGYP